MELLDLENIAKKEKIDIVNFKMNKTKARIINYSGTCIFMDYSNIDSHTEEKCLLAEELGHYYYDSYYTLVSSKQEIDRIDQHISYFQPESISIRTCTSHNSSIRTHRVRNYQYYNQ